MRYTLQFSRGFRMTSKNENSLIKYLQNIERFSVFIATNITEFLYGNFLDLLFESVMCITLSQQYLVDKY